MEVVGESSSPSVLQTPSGGEGGLGPRDFGHFLIATDALLDPAAPHASHRGLAFTKEVLEALEGDDLQLREVALRREFPDKWSFWLDVTRPHAMSAKAFKKALHVLGHCQSVASFCAEWNELLRGDTFTMYANLRLFKEGIKPLWEDANNRKGGKWVLVFPVDFASEEDAIPDQYIRMFLTLLVHMTAGQMGYDDELIRTFGIMITLWNRDAGNAAQIEFMKERLQELLMTTEEVRYQDHKGTMKNNETKRKLKAEQQALQTTGAPPAATATAASAPSQGVDKKKEKKPKALDTAVLAAPPPPALISVPPPPEVNPWLKPAPAAPPEVVKEKVEKAVEKVVDKKKEEAKKDPFAVPPKNPWGSPLKSYSWADEDELEEDNDSHDAVTIVDKSAEKATLKAAAAETLSYGKPPMEHVKLQARDMTRNFAAVAAAAAEKDRKRAPAKTSHPQQAAERKEKEKEKVESREVVDQEARNGERRDRKEAAPHAHKPRLEWREKEAAPAPAPAIAPGVPTPPATAPSPSPSPPPVELGEQGVGEESVPEIPAAPLPVEPVVGFNLNMRPPKKQGQGAAPKQAGSSSTAVWRMKETDKTGSATAEEKEKPGRKSVPAQPLAPTADDAPRAETVAAEVKHDWKVEGGKPKRRGRKGETAEGDWSGHDGIVRKLAEPTSAPSAVEGEKEEDEEAEEGETAKKAAKKPLGRSRPAKEKEKKPEPRPAKGREIEQQRELDLLLKAPRGLDARSTATVVGLAAGAVVLMLLLILNS